MLRASLISSLLVSYALVAQDPAAKETKRLSLQEAISTSLENNLQVQIVRETREATTAGALIAAGTFDWNLSASAGFGRTEAWSQSNIFPFPEGKSTTKTKGFDLGLSKAFGWGGTMKLSYLDGEPYYSSYETSYPLSNYNTSSRTYKGTFSATYTQNLLDGFGRKTTEANLIIARKGAEAANYTFQKQVIDLLAATESLYWDVVYAQRNLTNKKQALELAEKQLRENKIRVDVGTLAPIEVTSAEAQVALREQEIIAAEAAWQNAKDALLRALYPKTVRPGDLELTDAPTLGHIRLEESAAEKMALERRVELKAARLDMESKQVLEGAAKNRTLPTLDLTVGYSSKSSPSDTFGSMNSDIWGSKYPGYSVGLSFAMPILNSAARGNLQQARANRRSAEYSLRDLELGIALEVRTAYRNVDAAEKSVKAAEKTRLFREKDLDAEKKKFDNGMSTNFLVLSKQNDLDTSKASELQAQIGYAKAVTAMEKALGNLMEARKLEFPK